MTPSLICLDFGQALIKEMCPSIGGFQPVIHSRTLTFKPEKESIQVLNCDDDTGYVLQRSVISRMLLKCITVGRY